VSIRDVAHLETVLGRLVGTPLSIEVLKDKPGRRRTVRAHGPLGTVIAKSYASTRAPVVAQRVGALRCGPEQPEIPRVLLADPVNRLVVLSDVPGRPLSSAVIAGHLDTCVNVGAVLGRWHHAWSGRTPPGFRLHRIEDELTTLAERASGATAAVARAVAELADWARRPWPCPTVVHRDLYEEQIVIGEGVGLIDLDDAAAGPPELDLGNLFAHLGLLARRHEIDDGPVVSAILAGYASSGAEVDEERLDQCRYLSDLRLAALHAIRVSPRRTRPQAASYTMSKHRTS
jgi:Ser/Thr protein kinase RdoA (MazF antagonist)